MKLASSLAQFQRQAAYGNTMASFHELDWSRLDTFALLFGRGIASLESSSEAEASIWFSNHGYKTVRLDFSKGISPAVAELGKMLSWEQQFDYELAANSRNLDALHDGFEFEVPQEGGLVLELIGFDEALVEDKAWSTGFLAIVSEHSIHQLALGRRFFAILLVANDKSAIVGHVFEELSVSLPFHFRARAA